jgi:hypothetical protein
MCLTRAVQTSPHHWQLALQHGIAMIIHNIRRWACPRHQVPVMGAVTYHNQTCTSCHAWVMGCDFLLLAAPAFFASQSRLWLHPTRGYTSWERVLVWRRGELSKLSTIPKRASLPPVSSFSGKLLVGNCSSRWQQQWHHTVRQGPGWRGTHLSDVGTIGSGAAWRLWSLCRDGF